jgi:hypothetical protein
MAVMILRAEHGPNYTPPACTGVFGDVPCPSRYANWIERLAAEGITAGCGNGNFCPLRVVKRQQMATFLVNAFLSTGLTVPETRTVAPRAVQP